METTPEVWMLKRLIFACSEPMAWWQSYSYSLNTKGGRVFFSSSSAKKGKENDGGIADMEVPVFVLEDLSEMARAGGAVGSPKWENSASRVCDAPTHQYDLYWTDGTQTGPGAAAGHIMKYLRFLERKCAEEAWQCEPPENAIRDFWLIVKEEVAHLVASKKPGEPTKKMWTCTICGGTESTERFCAECGAPKLSK